jgi:hypothetical protein
MEMGGRIDLWRELDLIYARTDVTEAERTLLIEELGARIRGEALRMTAEALRKNGETLAMLRNALGRHSRQRRTSAARSAVLAVEAPTDDGAIFELLAQVGCRMPARSRGKKGGHS